jgi:hypothetical protein
VICSSVNRGRSGVIGYMNWSTAAVRMITTTAKVVSTTMTMRGSTMAAIVVDFGHRRTSGDKLATQFDRVQE